MLKSTVDYSKNVSNPKKLADLRSTLAEWIGEKYGLCRIPNSNFKGWQVYVEKLVDYGGAQRTPVPPQQIRSPPPPIPTSVS